MADQRAAGSEIPLRTHWFAFLWLLLFAGLVRSVSIVFGSWWTMRFTDGIWKDTDTSLGDAVRLAVYGAPAWIVRFFEQTLVIAVIAYGVFVILRTITGAPMRRWLHL